MGKRRTAVLYCRVARNPDATDQLQDQESRIREWIKAAGVRLPEVYTDDAGESRPWARSQ